MELGRPLTGCVALVTGAGGGIGRATCEALMLAGADVVATDICGAPSDTRAMTWIKQDVTLVDDWQHVIKDISRRFGRLDCLINNAGISLVESIENTSVEQWRRVLTVNVESVLLGLQSALPMLRESGSRRVGGASVVNVSSAAGLRGIAFHGAYCASKGAVTLLTKSAAREFAALGYPIRVNSLHPGSVDTPLMESTFARYVEAGLSASIDAIRNSINAAHPIGRMAKTEEIAAGVIFLCSPAASFVTGSELVIDGGMLS